MQDEVVANRDLNPQSGSGGQSPSRALGGLNIAGGSGSMSSESENGYRESVNQTGRVLVARSASPAKRTAADMEGHAKHLDSASGGFQSAAEQQQQSDFDEIMKGIDDTATQDTATTSPDASAQSSVTADSSAPSLDEEKPPAYAVEDPLHAQAESQIPPFDEQYARVMAYTQKSLLEGDRGVIFSTRWLRRVLARTSEGLKSDEFAKSDREGTVGPVDNSDVVPDGAFNERSLLHDVDDLPFVPLRPGLQMDADFHVLPFEVWDLIVGWYGCMPGQRKITRYARNSAPPEAAASNITYELYPPVFTIRKVMQSSQTSDQPEKPRTSLESMRLRQMQSRRGQKSPDDAIKFVSSRTERFVGFLRRCKEAALIPMEHKVKVWRQLSPSQVSAQKSDGRPLSPPASRSNSPNADADRVKLAVTPEHWSKMDIGSDIEYVDAQDETNNLKYNGKSTNDTFGLIQDQTLLLEEQLSGPLGGEFQSDSKKKPAQKFSLFGDKKLDPKAGSTTSSRAASPAPGMITRGRSRRDGRTRGTVGLTNLGNTCYMNSALQCIRSVEELAIYFLDGRFKAEINHDNPLGHNGIVAKQYAGVLEGIYGDKASSSFNPSNFKRTLGSVAPMFSGYGQQDSQEFLSFLVDAIHEDLNRIHKKPYLENPESDDRTVHDPQAIIDLGETFRSNHKQRNDSVAMDLFNGFYKNTMECPVCDKVSVTFDPYSLVTVQLPVENTFQHIVTFVPNSGLPVNHLIDMDKNSSIRQLKEVLAAKHADVDPKRLWVVEVYSHKIYKYFDDLTSIADAGIQNNDFIFCFELEDVPTNASAPNKRRTIHSSYGSTISRDDVVHDMDSSLAERMAVPVFFRRPSHVANNWAGVLHPMYILLTRDEAQDYDAILKKVLVRVAQLSSRPILTELEGDGAFEQQERAGTGDLEKTEDGSEDSNRISDRSVISEDGYVDVSLDSRQRTSIDTARKDGGSDIEMDSDEPDQSASQYPRIPRSFVSSQYDVSQKLRSGLFVLNYAESAEGMHCTSMHSFRDQTIRPMAERVKLRRNSVASTASEDSSSSTASGQGDGHDNADEDVSDADGETPSLRIAESPSSGADSEDELVAELPDNPLQEPSRDFRRQRGKPNKFGGGKKGKKNRKQYGRKGRQGRPDSRSSTAPHKPYRQMDGKSLPEAEASPYYVKLGEGIVLDLDPKAYEMLYGGNVNDDKDTRGRFTSHDDGMGQVPLFEDAEVDARINARKERKKNGLTLEDCFKETGKREVLSEDNAWYCNRCKELRRATKTLEIWTAPDILVVHLKRFGGNRSFRDKVDIMVNYPVEGLDLTDKVGLKEDGKEYVYDLFAIDNHFGGLGGGHYTAFAKNFYDGQWYDYNDSMVSKIGEGSHKLRSAAAYLLFYRRRSDKPLGPQYLQDLVNHFRNPPEPDVVGESAAEESDSGEGRLGDPHTSRLHGSSSAGTAGVGAVAGNRLLHGGGGPGANSKLKSRSLMTTSRPLDEDYEDEGVEMEGSHSPDTVTDRVVYGPVHPPQLGQFGDQGNATWSFRNLETVDDLNAEAGEGVLRKSIERPDDEDDANSSTGAEVNSAATDRSSGSTNLDDSSMVEYQTNFDSGAGRNTPQEPVYGTYDEHDMHPSAHEASDLLHEEQPRGNVDVVFGGDSPPEGPMAFSPHSRHEEDDK